MESNSTFDLEYKVFKNANTNIKGKKVKDKRNRDESNSIITYDDTLQRSKKENRRGKDINNKKLKEDC